MVKTSKKRTKEAKKLLEQNPNFFCWYHKYPLSPNKLPKCLTINCINSKNGICKHLLIKLKSIEEQGGKYFT